MLIKMRLAQFRSISEKNHANSTLRSRKPNEFVVVNLVPECNAICMIY